jgi:hypothetical protein
MKSFIIALAIMVIMASGLALALPNGQDAPAADTPVFTAEQIKMFTIKEATNLGRGEWYCDWTKFRLGVTMMYTDVTVEVVESAATLAEAARTENPTEITNLVHEFNSSKWDDNGAELGRMTLAFGINDSVDWVAFARAAGTQVVQRAVAGENNFPAVGRIMAAQAVDLAKSGQDRIWSGFGRRVGEALKRGTRAQWEQWGRQMGLQARSRAQDPVVDWDAFAVNIEKQSHWYATRLEPTEAHETIDGQN